MFISQEMEYNVKELKKVLIEQCKEEGRKVKDEYKVEEVK